MSDFLVPVDDEPELTPRGNGGGEMMLSETRVGDIVSMRRAARMMPRQPKEVRQQIAEMAEMFGDEWEYRFPVRNSRSGQTEFIEGPTIGCTMAVARAYGNNDVAHTRTEDEGNSWILYSTFVDLQTGFSLTRGFRQRKGQSRMGSDRSRGEDIDFQIGVSKSTRNVVARALDDFVRYARQCARHRLVGAIEKRPEEYRERVKSYLSEIGYSLTEIEGAVGAKLQDWTNEQIASVVRTLMAHKDGVLPDLDAVYRPKAAEQEATPQEDVRRATAQPNAAWLDTSESKQVRRAGPPTPREEWPGRHIDRTPERQAAAEREAERDAPPQDESPRRTRRSYEQIKADLIQDIRNAQSIEEVQAVLDSRDYANRSPEMKAEIDAEAEAMINALREANPETGEIGPDPDRGNLDDRVSTSDAVPEDFDRGEPTAAGAVTAALAPTYKLLGLAGTLIEMLPAEEWFSELEERIGETSLGQREKWLTVNGGIIQKILADQPDLALRVQDLVAKVNQEEK